MPLSKNWILSSKYFLADGGVFFAGEIMMDYHNFNKLKESENSLKIDKDLIEVQKTII